MDLEVAVLLDGANPLVIDVADDGTGDGAAQVGCVLADFYALVFLTFVLGAD